MSAPRDPSVPGTVTGRKAAKDAILARKAERARIAAQSRQMQAQRKAERALRAAPDRRPDTSAPEAEIRHRPRLFKEDPITIFLFVFVLLWTFFPLALLIVAG